VGKKLQVILADVRLIVLTSSVTDILSVVLVAVITVSNIHPL